MYLYCHCQRCGHTFSVELQIFSRNEKVTIRTESFSANNHENVGSISCAHFWSLNGVIKIDRKFNQTFLHIQYIVHTYMYIMHPALSLRLVREI